MVSFNYPQGDTNMNCFLKDFSSIGHLNAAYPSVRFVSTT